ncbi:hypothetical protein ACH5AO_06810 [Streptomyces sp. NPDC018964]|uniref:hypothetical protein n=1 Tax=unclassified Streptomyces TaxID=2593676 RepID=UPI0037B6FAD3
MPVELPGTAANHDGSDTTPCSGAAGSGRHAIPTVREEAARRDAGRAAHGARDLAAVGA